MGTQNIRDIKDQIVKLKKELKAAQKQQWEAYYKDRCPDHYISFTEFVGDLAFMNKTSDNHSLIDRFINKCNDLDDCHIPGVLDIASSCGFNSYSFVSDMICEACACNGCPCMEEHLGHSCKDCRQSGYQMYEGYCDE